jgi:hypothetical protein
MRTANQDNFSAYLLCDQFAGSEDASWMIPIIYSGSDWARHMGARVYPMHFDLSSYITFILRTTSLAGLFEHSAPGHGPIHLLS